MVDILWRRFDALYLATLLTTSLLSNVARWKGAGREGWEGGRGLST